MRCPICRRRFARGDGCPQHGAAAAEEREVLAPPDLDGVVVQGELGRGGFATVWAAVLGGRAVAVKVAHRGTDVARARAAREAAALRRLAGAYAPRLVAAGELHGRPYLILERLGATVEATLATGATCDLRAIEHVARAVAAAHAAGVIHGDLKPDNIVLDGDRARLLDLGSASVDGERAPVGAGVEYMAPELWRGDSATTASDVYALGAVACELATGQPPFVGDVRAVGHQHLMMRPVLDGIDPPIAALIRRCLAKDAAQRPTSAALALELAALEPDRATSRPVVRAAAAEERRAATRACVVAVVSVRAAATVLASAVARHRGELLHVRGTRSVVAFGAHAPAPAERALAFARALCAGDATGRAAIGVDDVPLDREGRLAPARATIEPPWLPPAWRGTIGTARVAALLDRDAPGELVDLGADAPPRDAHALVGRDAELAAVRVGATAWSAGTAARVAIVVGPPGSGRSRLARTIAREAAVPLLSARDPQATGVVDAALGIASTVHLPVVPSHDGTRHLFAIADTHAADDATSAAGAVTSAQVLAVDDGVEPDAPPTMVSSSEATPPGSPDVTMVSASAATPGTPDAPPTMVSASAAMPPGARDVPPTMVSASAGAPDVPPTMVSASEATPPGALDVPPTMVSASEATPPADPDAPPGAPSADESGLRAGVVPTTEGGAVRRRVRLVVDDAEDAGDALVDAVERAATRGAWICLAGGPAMRGRFARLLDAHDVDAIELGALPDDAAARLLEAALGVERVAEAVVHRLVASGQGRPRQLLAIAAHLRESGAVRTHPGSERRYLATDAVSSPSGGADAWLGEAALAGLVPEVRAVAAACACLAPAFELGELEVALEHVPNAADPEAGLVVLVTRGLAERTGDAWRLTSEPLRRAAALLADRYAIASAVLGHVDRTWADLDERRRRAVAHYATATGDAARARRLYLELAEDNRRAHRDSEAESDYSDALLLLEHAGDELRARGRAHLGRGIVRYRSDRAREAVADLDAAARIARGLGDAALEARARLEAATAHDWLGQYDVSAAEVRDVELLVHDRDDGVERRPSGDRDGTPHAGADREERRSSGDRDGTPHAAADREERRPPGDRDGTPHAADREERRPPSHAGADREARRPDPAIACALAMARGRTAVRESRYRDARVALEAALDVEGVHHEDDRLIAKLLLGPTFVQLGELDAAERVFASALADAERLGDTLGRSVAHGNRVLLWAARRDHERALADLASARDLARRIGHAVPERTTTYNLAEYLYWHGDLAEAARLAEVSRALQHGLVGEALEDDILIARIAAARGDDAVARAALDRAAATSRACPPAIALLRDATVAYLDRDRRRLDGLAVAAREALVGEELTEILAWRAAVHRAAGEPVGDPGDPGLQAWRFETL